MTTKEARIAVRVTHEQDALIRHAANTEGLTVTDFTVRAALAHAHDVLADRKLFLLDDAAWDEFLAILDRPAEPKPRLAALLSETDFFG